MWNPPWNLSLLELYRSRSSHHVFPGCERGLAWNCCDSSFRILTFQVGEISFRNNEIASIWVATWTIPWERPGRVSHEILRLRKIFGIQPNYDLNFLFMNLLDKIKVMSCNRCISWADLKISNGHTLTHPGTCCQSSIDQWPVTKLRRFVFSRWASWQFLSFQKLRFCKINSKIKFRKRNELENLNEFCLLIGQYIFKLQ